MYMKSYTLLALLAATMMSTTEAIELQEGASIQGHMSKEHYGQSVWNMLHSMSAIFPESPTEE